MSDADSKSQLERFQSAAGVQGADDTDKAVDRVVGAWTRSRYRNPQIQNRGTDPMNSQTVAALFVTMAALTWVAPNFNGIFFEASSLSDGEGRIISTILFVGAVNLWFMPPK
jgi:hypothetical protein